LALRVVVVVVVAVVQGQEEVRAQAAQPAARVEPGAPEGTGILAIRTVVQEAGEVVAVLLAAQQAQAASTLPLRALAPMMVLQEALAALWQA